MHSFALPSCLFSISRQANLRCRGPHMAPAVSRGPNVLATAGGLKLDLGSIACALVSVKLVWG